MVLLFMSIPISNLLEATKAISIPENSAEKSITIISSKIVLAMIDYSSIVYIPVVFNICHFVRFWFDEKP